MESPAELLGAITATLPAGGEDRPGQLAMAEAVARAVAGDRHLVVQAGTGTGKSLAYLVPLVQSGKKVVVATATKALQDQLADKDLPLVAGALADTRPLKFCVLKGRANYLCRQRLAEVAGGPPEALFDPSRLAAGGAADDDPSGADEGGAPPATGGAEPSPFDGRLADQVRRLVAWAQQTTSGDRSSLDFEPSARAWAAVSVTARECPGAFRCPKGPDCFAEHARARAAAADVVVVNTHLYATHVASGGSVLPEHDVVVLDEVHAVEEVMTAGLGVELTPGRVRAAAAAARGLLPGDRTGPAEALADAAARLEAVLRPLAGRRVLRASAGGRGRPSADEAELMAVLELATGRVEALLGGLRRAASSDDEPRSAEFDARRARAVLAASHLADDLVALGGLGDEQVAWVEADGPSRVLTLHAAPIEVGPVLATQLWPEVTAVLTSATVPQNVASSLGLPAAGTDHLDVGSPFPYRDHALLYCPLDLPDRRSPDAEGAQHTELRRLMEAAGGRTLALFTSWRAMRAAADALRGVITYPVLVQGERPKAALLADFAADEAACLFATLSFWQGVDVPGATLSLVAVDRLPFARPDDPLLEARRERAGAAAFREVDLPRAATLLAQGAGRLVRCATDRGVVAVLDPRLARAGYGSALRASLPPMRFTTDRQVALGFLEAIAAARAQ